VSSFLTTHQHSKAHVSLQVYSLIHGGTTGSTWDQQSTNDRKVAGSRPTKVVCITVLTGNRVGVNCPLWPAATPASEL